MTAIVRLKITLDDIEPKVMRRIEVPLDIRLDRLHLAIQAAMGWTNSHLYEIRARDIGWGLPVRGEYGGPLDARKARLVDALEDTGARTLKYVYDFGDNWEHTLKIERIEPAAPGVAYPRLLDAAGHCPPEDVGGYPGYMEMLEARADPSHERRAEFEEWIDFAAFDPNIADVSNIETALHALARKWARKTGPRKPRAT